MKTHQAIVVGALSIGVAVSGWAAAKAQQPSRAAGIFTEAQATAGQAAYAQSCAGCHGRTLTGAAEAPPLAGIPFMDSWGSRTIQELFALIRTSMPPESPNSLGDDTYAQIVAFLLRANGAQSASTAITPNTSVPIASIATGEMPAGLFASTDAGRGGRGRGGRGAGR